MFEIIIVLVSNVFSNIKILLNSNLVQLGYKYYKLYMIISSCNLIEVC